MSNKDSWQEFTLILEKNELKSKMRSLFAKSRTDKNSIGKHKRESD